MKVRIVTGYHRLDAHRSHAEYARLGHKLLSLPVPITFFCDRPDGFLTGPTVDVMPAGQYWLSEMISSRPSGIEPRLPRSDNPEKDTLAFHVIQHQKTKWLAQAAVEHPFDMLVWVDLGIFHVPGVTAEGVLSLVERALRLPTNQVTLASIWGPPTRTHCQASPVAWYCAGGVAITCGLWAAAWHGMVMAEAEELYRTCGALTYEVNTWASAWARNPQFFRHYLCDHNQTILEAA
jgi:hypothetical protein